MMEGGGLPGAQPVLQHGVEAAAWPPLVGCAKAASGGALLAAGKPADAAKAFTAAKADVGALATLGLGAVELAQAQSAAAKGLRTDARANGTPATAAAADYALAVIAYHHGAPAAWKQPPLAE